MAKRDDAALKLLRWELEGHGKVVMEAMLRHPDKSLAEAVDLIEQEVPSLSASDPSTNDSPSEMPAPVAPSRPRSPPELDALSQEFQTFRHLLHPKEAKEVEATLKELVRSQDRAAMTALRRRLRGRSATRRSRGSMPRRYSSCSRRRHSDAGRAIRKRPSFRFNA